MGEGRGLWCGGVRGGGRRGGGARAAPSPLLPRPAWWSPRPILIPAPVLGVDEAGEGVDGGAGIGVRIEAAAAFGTDASPLAEEEGAAEEVGPDFHAVVAPFVVLGADADEGCGFREERELDGGSRCGECVAAFGHDVAGSVSPAAQEYQRKVGETGCGRRFFGCGCYTISHSVSVL
jgi:hypothetical protein